MTDRVLVRARNIVKTFAPRGGGMMGKRKGQGVRAVDGIDLDIHRSETLALVGESGCGKSTTGRLLMKLVAPTSGELSYDGIDLLALDEGEFRKIRKRMQLIFQDPMSAFNPRMKVREIVAEPLRLSGGTRAECDARVAELLPLVGLAAYQADRFPHEFSGGQRQRIGIARALAVRPELIICDEPVSALDVSIQAQVINLLTDLQQRYGLTYLFISHDLRVVRHIADRVAVMYLGRIVEIGAKHDIYTRPQHPYTKALIGAVPLPNPQLRRAPLSVSGEVPSANNVPPGCRFHTRCPHVMPVCKIVDPVLQEGASGHKVACHLVSPTS